jgi:hypothetical protein
MENVAQKPKMLKLAILGLGLFLIIFLQFFYIATSGNDLFRLVTVVVIVLYVGCVLVYCYWNSWTEKSRAKREAEREREIARSRLREQFGRERSPSRERTRYTTPTSEMLKVEEKKPQFESLFETPSTPKWPEEPMMASSALQKNRSILKPNVDPNEELESIDWRGVKRKGPEMFEEMDYEAEPTRKTQSSGEGVSLKLLPTDASSMSMLNAPSLPAGMSSSLVHSLRSSPANAYSMSVPSAPSLPSSQTVLTNVPKHVHFQGATPTTTVLNGSANSKSQALASDSQTANSSVRVVRELIKSPTTYSRSLNIENWWRRFRLYVENNNVPLNELRTLLLYYLDDDCSAMAECNLPDCILSLDALEREVLRLFGKLESNAFDHLGRFYNRRQQPGEDVRSYMTELWKLARESARVCDWTQDNMDSSVRDRFIQGLDSETVMMYLLQKHPRTSREALWMACDVVSQLSLTKPKADGVSKIGAPMNNVSTSQTVPDWNLSGSVSGQPSLPYRITTGPSVSSSITCHYCKEPGHLIARCYKRQKDEQEAQVNVEQARAGVSASTPATNRASTGGFPNKVNTVVHVRRRRNRSKSNKHVVVCQFGSKMSIGGFCWFNSIRFWCLFDTGSELTLMSESAWRLCANCDLEPSKVGLESCVGMKLRLLGKSKLHFKSAEFEGEIEVVVVNGLSYDCLLGLDVAEKMPTINKALQLIKGSLTNGFEHEAATSCVGLSGEDNILKESLHSKVSTKGSTDLQKSHPWSVNVVACGPSNEGPTSEGVTHNSKQEHATRLFEDSVEVAPESLSTQGEQPIEIIDEGWCSGLAELKSSQLSVEQTPDIAGEFENQVRSEFSDLLADSLAQLTQTSTCEHEINLTEAKPFKQAVRRVPFALRGEFKSIIDEMLDTHIIVPSESPYASPTVIVRKHDGSMRICVDYRKLNELTVKDCYPIPKIEDIIARLGKASIFSKLDLASGYHQVKLRVEDRHKTAFITEFGLFEYTVMPFGLTNAPATFQRLMERVLAPLIDRFVAVFFDDVMIYSLQIDLHYSHVAQALELIRQANLKLKWKKCEWLKLEIEYLGHIIRAGQVLPAPSKVSALFKYDRPKTVKQLQAFLGLANYYRRFVPQLSEIARPLYQATTQKSLKWTDECEVGFNKVRTYLSETDGVLVLPDFNKPFRVECDASKWCIGAVLSQKVDGQFRPIAYFSKSMNSAQRNYSASERELLAVVESFKHFRQYLLGRRFTAITDHQALVWLSKLKEPAARLARWLIALREYEFDIEYRNGAKNGNADALSRWTLPDEQNNESESDDDPGIIVNHVILKETEVNERQLDDEDVFELYQWIEKGQKPERIDAKRPELLIYWRQFNRFRIFGKNVFRTVDDPNVGVHFQYVVPKSDRADVLTKIHDDPFCGHLGKDRTFLRLKERFYWPNYEKQASAHVRTCDTCARIKAPPQYNQEPLVPLRATRPFQLVTMDIMGPFATTERGNKYLLVMIDHFSKWVELFALSDQTAEDVAKCVSLFVCRHGVPDSILTDLGTNFQAVLISQLFDQLDVHRLRTSAYHPQCDGESERFNRTIQQMLSCYLADNPGEWDELLPKMAFAYCTSVHATTGLTPFEIVYGRKPKLPADMIFPSAELDIQLGEGDYTNKLKKDLLNIYKLVQDKSAAKVDKMKFYADRNVRPSDYGVGERVWLFDETKKKGPHKKIGWKWLGPFTIVEKRNERNYVLKPDKRGRKILANSSRMKRCFAPNFQESSPDTSAIFHSTALAEPIINDSVDFEAIKRRRHCRPRRKQQEGQLEEEADKTLDVNEGLGRAGADETLDVIEKHEESTASDDNDEVNLLSMDPQFLGLQEDEEAGSSEEVDLYEPNYYYAKQMQAAVSETNDRPKRSRKPPDRLGYATAGEAEY